MQVFILARTQNEITEQIYPALTDAGDSDKIEISVAGYATSTDNLAGQLQATRPDAILVRMTLSNRGDETALLESLAAHQLPLIVMLPRGRKGLAESLRVLPGVAAVTVEPVDYAALLQAVAGEPAPTEAPESASAQTPPPHAPARG